MIKTEAEIRAESVKMSVPDYIMKYHKIRWALVNYDIERMRF